MFEIISITIKGGSNGELICLCINKDIFGLIINGNDVMAVFLVMVISNTQTTHIFKNKF